MLAALAGKGSQRKLRLFACACCRAVWHQVTDERGRRVVAVAERFADGQAEESERGQAVKGAEQWADESDDVTLPIATSWAGVKPRDDRMVWFAAEVCSHNVRCAVRGGKLVRLHVSLLRCIFGNPFRPVSLNPAWQNPHAVQLARAAYEERNLPGGELDAARLAVLADALEEAGCTDAAILDHLRGPGPHVRGCFVLDLLLGKV
jgi:hypothetical protein